MNVSKDRVFLDSVEFLASRGFHGKVIAEATGLSIGQVYARAKFSGVKLRDYRDGKTTIAREAIRMSPTVKMKVTAEKGQRYKIRGLNEA